jgi:hypothetical protein
MIQSNLVKVASSSSTTPLSTPLARPRLVAKVGGTTREPSPLLNGPGTPGGKSAGADGKDVWNKNKNKRKIFESGFGRC